MAMIMLRSRILTSLAMLAAFGVTAMGVELDETTCTGSKANIAEAALADAQGLAIAGVGAVMTLPPRAVNEEEPDLSWRVLFGNSRRQQLEIAGTSAERDPRKHAEHEVTTLPTLGPWLGAWLRTVAYAGEEGPKPQ